MSDISLQNWPVGTGAVIDDRRDSALPASTDARGIERVHPSGQVDDQLTFLPVALNWYRSRDIARVTAATHWFVSIDIQAQLDILFAQMKSADPFVVDTAKRSVAAFSEFAAKRVVDLLEDPEMHGHAVDILSSMDEFVLPHLLRWSRNAGSFNSRVGLLRALIGRVSDPRVATLFSDALRDSDPILAALTLGELLAAGPRGHELLRQVRHDSAIQAA